MRNVLHIVMSLSRWGRKRRNFFLLNIKYWNWMQLTMMILSSIQVILLGVLKGASHSECINVNYTKQTNDQAQNGKNYHHHHQYLSFNGIMNMNKRMRTTRNDWTAHHSTAQHSIYEKTSYSKSNAFDKSSTSALLHLELQLIRQFFLSLFSLWHYSVIVGLMMVSIFPLLLFFRYFFFTFTNFTLW